MKKQRLSYFRLQRLLKYAKKMTGVKVYNFWIVKFFQLKFLVRSFSVIPFVCKNMKQTVI